MDSYILLAQRASAFHLMQGQWRFILAKPAFEVPDMHSQ
jgi:hypothetical protein